MKNSTAAKSNIAFFILAMILMIAMVMSDEAEASISISPLIISLPLLLTLTIFLCLSFFIKRRKIPAPQCDFLEGVKRAEEVMRLNDVAVYRNLKKDVDEAKILHTQTDFDRGIEAYINFYVENRATIKAAQK